MPVDDVLDDGEPEARPAFLAALGHVDPVKPLRQARQMLRRDARAVIPDRKLDEVPAVRARATSTRPPLSPYLTRFDEVLHDPKEFVPVPSHEERFARQFDLDVDPRSRASERVSTICATIDLRSTTASGARWARISMRESERRSSMRRSRAAPGRA